MGIVIKARTKFPQHTPIDQIMVDFGNGLKETGEGIKRDFQKTTKTWEHQPVFEIEKITNGVRVGTSDELYVLVNKGAPPHVISAKKAPFLVFQSGFGSKTEPLWIGSRKGKHFGPTVIRKEVNHPGFQAREFDVIIAERWKHKVGQVLRVSVHNSLKNWTSGYTTINIG